MYLLYSILLFVGVVAFLPRFLLDAWRHGKYAAGLRERMGQLPAFDAQGRPVIWLHCVSVGETQAARPLVRAILDQYPAHALVVSTTTLTGQRVAREAYGRDAALVFYFPFDWAWSVRRALAHIRPTAVLIMETELWPRFLRECRARRVPVALVNGRISENSFRRYSLVKFFIRRIVRDLSLAIMQTDSDAARIAALGLDAKRIRISGNIKFDSEEQTHEQALTDELRRRFQFQEGRPLIIAASTHAPEERLLLEAFRRLHQAQDERRAAARPRLLIAPRHPERFAEVALLLAASGFTWTRRSATPDAHDATCDVVLLDSIGELRATYPLAELVFVGGSLAPVGGHNVLEPALAARCIVTGAHTSNFAHIIRTFLEQEALVQLPALSDAEAPTALARVFGELLADAGARRRAGERARRTLEQSRGATARTIEMLAPILQQRFETRGGMAVHDRVLTSGL